MRQAAHELRDLTQRIAAAAGDAGELADMAQRAVVLAAQLAERIEVVHRALDRIVMAELGAPVTTAEGRAPVRSTA